MCITECWTQGDTFLLCVHFFESSFDLFLPSGPPQETKQEPSDKSSDLYVNGHGNSHHVFFFDEGGHQSLNFIGYSHNKFSGTLLTKPRSRKIDSWSFFPFDNENSGLNFYLKEFSFMLQIALFDVMNHLKFGLFECRLFRFLPVWGKKLHNECNLI